MGEETSPLRSPFQLGGPFDFCAFALLSELPLGSLLIALKCTRPRQRFVYVVGRYSMTEGGMSQEGDISFSLTESYNEQTSKKCTKWRMIRWIISQER